MSFWKWWRHKEDEVDPGTQEVEECLAKMPAQRAQAQQSIQAERASLHRSIELAEETLRVLRKTER